MDTKEKLREMWLGKKLNDESPHWKGIGTLSGYKFSVMKNNARLRSIKFDISIEYVWNLYESQNKKCAYSGIDIYWQDGSSRRRSKTIPGTASLDRINSDDYYHINNIQIIHKDVNKMKNDLKQQQFFEYIKLIINPLNNFVSEDVIPKKYRGNFKGYGNVSGKYLDYAKQHCKKKPYNYLLSAKDAWYKFLSQNGTCYFTGLPLKLTNYKYKGTASIDRINCKGDYEKNNIRWVHKDINDMRWNFDDEYFLYLCNLIYKHKELKNT